MKQVLITPNKTVVVFMHWLLAGATGNFAGCFDDMIACSLLSHKYDGIFRLGRDQKNLPLSIKAEKKIHSFGSVS